MDSFLRVPVPCLVLLAALGGCETLVEGMSGTDGPDGSTSSPSTTVDPATTNASTSTSGEESSTGGTSTGSPTTDEGTTTSTTNEETSTSSETTDGTSTGMRAVCGDGIVEGGEACDDGDENSDVLADACRTSCELPTCGDGVTDSKEVCDDGDENSDVLADACRTTCALASCGDGVTDSTEACDDGDENSDVLADACRTTCVVASCGDEVVDSIETCDDGVANSDVLADACRTTCTVAGCGDGVQDTAESCDDSNAAANDGCSAACAIELGFQCVSMPSVCGPASILVNGDFEDSSAGDPVVSGSTFPAAFPGTALWFADLSAFVPTEAGITPLNGDAMLHFQATGNGPSNFTSCNVQQAVDMAPYAGLIAQGRVTLEATASFNRVSTAIDSEFRLRVFAYSGSEGTGFTQLDASVDQVFADLNEETWEQGNTSLELPVTTTFVVIALDAFENNQNDTTDPELLGHYADLADLRVVVAPPA